MTWPWRICFSAALAANALAATVTGAVRLVDSQDAKVRRKGDFSGVVVWLESAGPPPLEAKPRRVQVIQKDKRFAPHIAAIPVGSTVDFPNLDPIFHNAFSNFSGQPFDVGLYAPGTSQRVQFVREGVVRVFCNIHPTMSAVIVVLNSPWFSVTNAAGEFSISAPPGDYRLKFFHERAQADVLTALERSVTVGSDDVALGVVAISEAGYLVPPHKNKYGKDYPAVIVDQYGTSGRH